MVGTGTTNVTDFAAHRARPINPVGANREQKRHRSFGGGSLRRGGEARKNRCGRPRRRRQQFGGGCGCLRPTLESAPNKGSICVRRQCPAEAAPLCQTSELE